MMPLMMLAVLLFIGLITDIRSRKIPNALTVPAAAIGVLYALSTDGWSGLRYSLAGAAVSFGVMVVLYILKAVGAGDVKLFTAIGALVGMALSLYILFYSVLYAGLIALLYIMVRNRWTEIWNRIRALFVQLYILRDYTSWTGSAKGGTRFPFMLAVVPGAITALLYIQ